MADPMRLLQNENAALACVVRELKQQVDAQNTDDGEIIDDGVLVTIAVPRDPAPMEYVFPSITVMLQHLFDDSSELADDLRYHAANLGSRNDTFTLMRKEVNQARAGQKDTFEYRSYTSGQSPISCLFITVEPCRAIKKVVWERASTPTPSCTSASVSSKRGADAGPGPG